MISTPSTRAVFTRLAQRCPARCRLGVTLAAAILATGPACNSPQPTPRTFAVVDLPPAPQPELFDAVEAVLIAQGYELEGRPTDEGRFVTVPVPVEASAPTGDRAAPLRRRQPLREVVEVRVVSGRDGASVFCKVHVQERTGALHQMFARETSGTDVPSETAIEREAATTAEQDAAWRTVYRDRAKEHELLTALAELFPSLAPVANQPSP